MYPQALPVEPVVMAPQVLRVEPVVMAPRVLRGESVSMAPRVLRAWAVPVVEASAGMVWEASALADTASADMVSAGVAATAWVDAVPVDTALAAVAEHSSATRNSRNGNTMEAAGL